MRPQCTSTARAGVAAQIEQAGRRQPRGRKARREPTHPRRVGCGDQGVPAAACACPRRDGRGGDGRGARAPLSATPPPTFRRWTVWPRRAPTRACARSSTAPRPPSCTRPKGRGGDVSVEFIARERTLRRKRPPLRPPPRRPPPRRPPTPPPTPPPRRPPPSRCSRTWSRPGRRCRQMRRRWRRRRRSRRRRRWSRSARGRRRRRRRR